MRKMMIMVLLLFTSMVVVGQEGKDRRWSVTPYMGTNLWTARYNYGTSKAMDRQLGLTAGAELGYRLQPRVELSLGTDYVLQRFRQSLLNGNGMLYTGDRSCTISTGRACFPLMIGADVWKGLSLRAGIQLGVTLHTNTAKIKYETVTVTLTNGERMYHFDPIHWYLPVGLSYEYKRWVADLRYYYSLKKNHWKVEDQGITASAFRETHQLA